MKKLLLAALVCTFVLLAVATTADAKTVTLKSLAKTVAALQKKVNAQAATIVSLRGTVADQGTTISSQGATIATLSSKLNSDEGTIAAQGTTISSQGATIATLSSKLNSDEATIAAQGTTLSNAASVLAIAPYVSLTTGAMNGVTGPNIVFQGCNVHVRDGSGATNCNPSSVNSMGTQTGLGNLIVGYDERYSTEPRGGSNNLIVGIYHTFTGAGSFVDGRANTISAEYAAVSGGVGNTASAEGAAVSGGVSNQATAMWSAVSGGTYNVASNYEASVSGGVHNTASGQYSSVSGGGGTTAAIGLTVSGSAGWAAGNTATPGTGVAKYSAP
jgi:trimeric autotransporter adhesin